MKKAALALVFLMALITGFSKGAYAQQKGKVTGMIVDTATQKAVNGVTISILDKKDSSLVSFSMTGTDGRFEITGLPIGEFRMMASHVAFHNSNKYFTISADQPAFDLGRIPFTDKYKSLDEVIIQAEAPPVTLKADTIEYNAGSFKTQPNANVEDLLKKLPGVKVEKDGTVKAQGQTVNKVFVDGKEFFGNDPKMATKNLPADAIDKVQVYDRLSDQAQMTGFDDGNSERSINLKLKKDKKKGVFGKAMAGAGTRDRYEGRFNLNSFKGARQLSVLGVGNNTNAEAFSFMDMLTFSGDRPSISGGGGNISVNLSSDGNGMGGLLGGNQNNGINTIWGGGVNYNDLIGTKLDLRSNYFYNRYSPKTESELERQYFLPDSSYYFSQKGQNERINNSHRLNLILDYAIDSFHSVRIAPSLGFQQSDQLSKSVYQTLNGSKLLTNDGFNRQLTSMEGYNFRNDLLFRKKFRKKSRSFSFALQNLYNRSYGNGEQESINRFYDAAGSITDIDSINQYSNSGADMNGYTARAVYTEPVFRKALLEFSVANSSTKLVSEKQTYDYNKSSGKFDELNPLLSNDYNNRYGYSNAGIRFRKQHRKLNWAAGIAWQYSELKGETNGTLIDSIIKKDFRNLLPNARVQYQFNRFSNLTLNYQTMTNQPTISQLQPLPDISNPLSIILGNPQLKQEYTQTTSLNLMKVNPIKQTNIFGFLSFRHTTNKIVNSDSISTSGIKYSRPVNVNGVYNFNGDFNWGFPFKLIKKSSVNIGLNAYGSKSKQYINKTENRINDLQISPELRFELNPTDKINTSVSFGTAFNHTKYSLQPDLSTKYFTHELGIDASWELPLGFYISSDFNYRINAKRADGYNVNVPLWNASVSKFILKYNRGQIGLRVFDILNQNVGISRTSNNNYIEDRKVTVLKRYVLLSFTFSLNKTGLSGGGGPGNIRVISR